MFLQDGTMFHSEMNVIGNRVKFGFKRELPPMVFTNQFAYLMEGEDSEPYKRFIELGKKGLLALKYSKLLYILLGGMDEILFSFDTWDNTLQEVRERLMNVNEETFHLNVKKCLDLQERRFTDMIDETVLIVKRQQIHNRITLVLQFNSWQKRS